MANRYPNALWTPECLLKRRPSLASIDQTPAFDPADPEPIPELDLNQTRGA